MYTLRQIFQSNGQVFPFAARLKFWAKDTYVVILQFGAWIDEKKIPEYDLSQHPLGIPLTADQQNNIFNGDNLFSKHFLIPRYDYPDWELVEGLDLSRFEKKYVHGLNNYIQFGKHTGWLIRDLINRHTSYIEWAIRTVEDFTLDDEALAYVSENFPTFDSLLIAVAKNKQETIREYETELQEQIQELSKIVPNKDWEGHIPTITIQSKNWDRVEESEELKDVKQEKKFIITDDFINELHSSIAKDKGGVSGLYVNDKLKWTPSDIVQLKGLLSKGASDEQIGNIMRRKAKTIRKKIVELKLDK